MDSVMDKLKMGKVITLKKAAQQLAEANDEPIDLRWTLRFCLESYVKLCIRLPHPILTWERKQEPDWGEDCGKCDDITEECGLCKSEDEGEMGMSSYGDNGYMTKPSLSGCDDVTEERGLCKSEDEGEAGIFSYGDNGYMTKPSLKGKGDYIANDRFGVLFVSGNEMQSLTYPDTDKVKCKVFYDEDESWHGGYCRFEIASMYEYMMDDLKESEIQSEAFQEVIVNESRKDYLELGLSDLWVDSADFAAALKGKKEEERKALPMYGTENKKESPKERNKMLGVILAMAMDKYGYNPKDKTNKATGTSSTRGSIAYGAAELGINVNEGTVKKYLEQGYVFYRENMKNI